MFLDKVKQKNKNNIYFALPQNHSFDLKALDFVVQGRFKCVMMRNNAMII